jgi:hypothetical protein
MKLNDLGKCGMVDFDKVNNILTWISLEFTSRLCNENDPSYREQIKWERIIS